MARIVHGLPITSSFRLAPLDMTSCAVPSALTPSDALGDDEREAFNALIDSWFDVRPESPRKLAQSVADRAVTPTKELVMETQVANRKRPRSAPTPIADDSDYVSAAPTFLLPARNTLNHSHQRCPRPCASR